MESKLNVVVLSHTPEFEQNIVRGARLCYSSASIEGLRDKVTPEDAERFLNMILEIGHGSILEHSSITFGIEGVSRSLTHQLVRHRIGCSYSQKSQRYVSEGQFEYIIPKPIAAHEALKADYIKMMERLQEDYNHLTLGLLKEQIKEQFEKGYENQLLKEALSNEVTGDKLVAIFKETDKKLYSKLEKVAIENARYVLPNACETKIQVTMNVRALFSFFKERLCDRAQEEIRDMAFEMWKACMEISPTIFKYAVPTCVHGKCKEGKMTCGKMLYYKKKHGDYIARYEKK
ncbi:MAG: FAD-dependent thymidylate synthase [Cellulosilyticum sp.]|nr:FAD-dependent thymidylate synthase [Cellulosilyticum sp.]